MKIPFIPARKPKSVDAILNPVQKAQRRACDQLTDFSTRKVVEEVSINDQIADLSQRAGAARADAVRAADERDRLMRLDNAGADPKAA